MMAAGIIVFVLGLLWAAIKSYVVWDCARDVYNGGGAPVLDFPVICPIPLAVGLSWMLRAQDWLPFPGFGFAAYVGLAAIFGFVLWLFYRLGKPERRRRLLAIEQKAADQSEA